ncbi:MAG: hypothetical protein ACTHMD_15100 [Flavisolibacter sp.]
MFSQSCTGAKAMVLPIVATHFRAVCCTGITIRPALYYKLLLLAGAPGSQLVRTCFGFPSLHKGHDARYMRSYYGHGTKKMRRKQGYATVYFVPKKLWCFQRNT